MTFTKLPTKAEDTERLKLKELAAKYNWAHRSGDPEIIEGMHEGKSILIGVDQKRFEVDVLYYKSQSNSQITGSIVREDFITRGGKALAAFMQKFGSSTYCDIETGDDFLDKNYHFNVNAQNKAKLEALVSHHVAQPLLKDLLSYFEQITFESSGISFYKLVETGDLDNAKVQETIAKVIKFDQLDGMYA